MKKNVLTIDQFLNESGLIIQSVDFSKKIKQIANLTSEIERDIITSIKNLMIKFLKETGNDFLRPDLSGIDGATDASEWEEFIQLPNNENLYLYIITDNGIMEYHVVNIELDINHDVFLHGIVYDDDDIMVYCDSIDNFVFKNGINGYLEILEAIEYNLN